jgi:hypothetical protein
MCQKVPDPPPNVDFSAIETPGPNLHTMREKLEFHRTNPVCAGCHKLTDPMGLALENFDGAGQYRALEKNIPIDASGRLDGVNFSDARGLAQAIRNNRAITSCVVRRLYQYGVGRSVGKEESAVLSYLEARFAEKGYSFPALLRTIATSDAFFRVSSGGDDQSVSARLER